MSDCDHLNHPEYWLGDAGDVVNSLTPALSDQARWVLDRMEMARDAYTPTWLWLARLGAIR